MREIKTLVVAFGLLLVLLALILALVVGVVLFHRETLGLLLTVFFVCLVWVVGQVVYANEDLEPRRSTWRGLRRYWAYVHYVVRHKWFVMVECFKLGIYWRGITHDLSKFRPGEFIPYARYFYNPDGSRSERVAPSILDEVFDTAWLCHQKRNDHHWQYWVLREDDSETKALTMPINATKELVADWLGVGMALRGVSSAGAWYEENKNTLRLHPVTKLLVEGLLTSRASQDEEENNG